MPRFSAIFAKIFSRSFLIEKLTTFNFHDHLSFLKTISKMAENLGKKGLKYQDELGHFGIKAMPKISLNTFPRKQSYYHVW